MTRLNRFVCAALLVAACTTPVIPLPPPDINNMTFRLEPIAMPPVATFLYSAQQEYDSARVFVVNETQGVGVIVTANPDGSVDETPPFAADAGDRIVVTFETFDDSAAICVILRDGQLNANSRCP